MTEMPIGKKPTPEQEAETEQRKSQPVPAEPEVQAQYPVLTRCWRCGCVNNNNTYWNGFYCGWCGTLNSN